MLKKFLFITVLVALLTPFNALNAQLSAKESLIYTESVKNVVATYHKNIGDQTGKYNGKMEGYELDPRATLIDYKGLQIQREFMAPVYENQAQIDSRSPDFRHLLHWSANINTSTKGKINTSFYTSDLAGKYAIIVQGISKQGQPLYKEITFIVQ